jgi:hypothetical protein
MQKSQNQRKSQFAKQLFNTFKDRYGHLDPKALTAFLSFIILIVSWAGDQFWGKKLNEPIMNVFAFLVFSLLGLKVLPWRKDGMLTEQEINQSPETKEPI